MEQEHEALADRRHVRERRARPLGVQRRRADELLRRRPGIAGERAAAEPAVGVADEDGGAVGGVAALRSSATSAVEAAVGAPAAAPHASSVTPPDASAASTRSGADGLHQREQRAAEREGVRRGGACAPRSSPATS